MRISLTRYAKVAVTADWPAMERGGASHAATRALEVTNAAPVTFTSGDGRGTGLLTEALHQLDLMTGAARDLPWW